MLDSVILFSLTIPFVMNYRLSTGGTPYWLFTFLFILLGGHFFVKSSKFKAFLVWLVIILTIGSAYFSSIAIRNKTAPEFGVHDIILQQEAAIRYFLQGKNPYKETYFGTPLEKWHYSDHDINPALYHFVMPPFYLLFALPFYFFNISLFNFFDGRIPLVFCFFGILYLINRWVKEDKRSLALALFAFNPATLDYFMEGRSDFFMMFFLLASLFFLRNLDGRKEKISTKRSVFAGVFLGLAFSIKQSVWPIFPFYIFYLWKKGGWEFLVKNTIGLAVAFLTINLPFFFWDTKAYIDSIVLYLSGSLDTSYPISGYGFGILAKSIGLVKDGKAHVFFPVLQLIFGIPVMIFLLKKYLLKKPSIKMVLFCYGTFLLVFWYFARYFNNSHLGYISSVFLVSYFIPEKNEIK